MTSEPKAFLTFDAGAATIAASLIGRMAGRWRLIGSLALPAGADPAAVASALVDRAVAADPGLTSSIGLRAGIAADLPRLSVSSHRPQLLAVVAASERALAPLLATASRSGWRTVAATAETTDPLALSRMLLESEVRGILVGAADPPAADERRGLAELAALVAAVAERREDLTVILAGGMAAHLPSFGPVAGRPGETLLGPAAGRGPAGGPLGELLLGLALPADDARRALGGAVQTLADILDRRVDVVEIGHDAGSRAGAWPAVGNGVSGLDLAVVSSAALVPDDPDDTFLDRVGSWSTLGADRHRLRDRLHELRIAPWSDATGDGAALRMAAARVALGRLAESTQSWVERPAADLVVATGGVWAVASAPAVALALVDVLRRHGASQFALDHARLLAPLGVIPDAAERRAMIADLADDLLVPLGTIVTPVGLRPGRTAGALVVHGATGSMELDLVSGGLSLVDLPPGRSAVAEFRFRDTVRLGATGRHFAVDVTGGLGGLLVDLRDVPLRLPDRADRRAELLETWQASLRPGRAR